VVQDRETPNESGTDQAQFLQELEKAKVCINQSLSEGGLALKGQYPRRYVEKLAVLRALISMNDPVITPDLDPLAPRGHSYNILKGDLNRLGEDLYLLEELADLGLLKRELFNCINLCPNCGHCQINFRETCPSCGSFDNEIERLIHHFHCAYCGLESEFVSGIELVCPKCRKVLHQLGQDFERPHDTYICRSCTSLFEEPAVDAQCLNCAREFPGSEVEVKKIYRYRPTLFTVRAVELNRLTGLNISEIMYDSHIRLATSEFLRIEAEREIFRMRRYGGALAVAMLTFELNGETYPIFREWRTETLKKLGTMLKNSHRTLDILARIDMYRVGLLYPHTDEPGLNAVITRLTGRLHDLSLMSRDGKPLEFKLDGKSWEGKSMKLSEVLAFFDLEEEGV
jgi:hypothetical protein